MLKRFILLFVAAVFVFCAAGPAFGDNEDEIVAKFLKKKDKVIERKVGFVSGHFMYGRLPENNGYGVVDFSAENSMATVSGSIHPHEGIFRSREFGLQLGLMVKQNVSLQLGFDYWMPMGTPTTVDYTTTIGVLSIDDNFTQESEVSVYGFNIGSSYYFLDTPDRDGILHSLALKAGLGLGYYSSTWNMWNESAENYEPLNGSSFSYYVEGGVEYPTPMLNMVVGFSSRYQYLNLSGFSSYNSESGDLTLSKAIDGQELNLDFSGFRAQIELKRYLSW